MPIRPRAGRVRQKHQAVGRSRSSSEGGPKALVSSPRGSSHSCSRCTVSLFPAPSAPEKTRITGTPAGRSATWAPRSPDRRSGSWVAYSLLETFRPSSAASNTAPPRVILAAWTSLRAGDLPDDLRDVRSAIEQAVPHGRTDRGGRNDRGSWNAPPSRSLGAWKELARGYERIVDDHPKLGRNNPPERQMGTLGTGNHFIEVCLDEADHVWFLLHSGSRGVGNRIGTYFIEKAREEMRKLEVHLPDRDLAYLREGTRSFDDYVEAGGWGQAYA